jgi:hypothetical protein
MVASLNYFIAEAHDGLLKDAGCAMLHIMDVITILAFILIRRYHLATRFMDT